MRIGVSLSDQAVLDELGGRLAASRLRRNLTQAELARESGLSKRTVEALEAGGSVRLVSLLRVLRVLDLLAGFDSLVPEQGPSPIELWKLGSKRRRRASGGSASTDPESWSWGEDGE